jgi:hypothetical protein
LKHGKPSSRERPVGCYLLERKVIASRHGFMERIILNGEADCLSVKSAGIEQRGMLMEKGTRKIIV